MRVWSSSRARWAPAFGDEAGNSSPGRLLARPSVVILELVDRAFQKLPAMIAGQRPCAKVPISHRRKSHSWLELPVTKPQLRGGAPLAASRRNSPRGTHLGPERTRGQAARRWCRPLSTLTPLQDKTGHPTARFRLEVVLTPASVPTHGRAAGLAGDIAAKN